MEPVFNVIILAAGKGTRLKSDFPKALAPILSMKLIDFPIQAGKDFAKLVEHKVVTGLVVGHQKEVVSDYLKSEFSEDFDNFKIAVQEEQKGTAHAVECFFNQRPECKDNAWSAILCVDTPLIDGKILADLFLNRIDSARAIAASFVENKTHQYGRILRGEKGFVIREHKDASESERKVNEVNSGLYIVETKYLLEELSKIDDQNESSEFYLTDIFKQEESCEARLFPRGELFGGVNSLTDLTKLTKLVFMERNKNYLDNGVLMVDESSVYIDGDVEIGQGTKIYPNVVIEGSCKIGANVTIESGVIIKNSEISDGCKILGNSYLEECKVGSSSSIGPFARLRPQTEVKENCKIGNFVETKKSVLKKGAKVSHLSYVGDSEIGENTNIGCGFISVNYDGKNKHKTIVGDNSFIGSGSQLIAPIEVGSDSFVAAGSTCSQDVPDGTFAIARSRQVNKAGMAKRFLKKKS